MQVVFFRSKKSPEDRFCFSADQISSLNIKIKQSNAPGGKACRWFSSGQKSLPKIFSALPGPHQLPPLLLLAKPLAGALLPTLCPAPVLVPPSLSKLPQICWSLSSPPSPPPPPPCPSPPCLSQNVSPICSVLPLPLPRRLLAGLHLAPWNHHHNSMITISYGDADVDDDGDDDDDHDHGDGDGDNILTH